MTYPYDVQFRKTVIDLFFDQAKFESRNRFCGFKGLA